MKKGYLKRAVLTAAFAVTVLSAGAALGTGMAAGPQNVAAATVKPRYQKVFDSTITYGAKEWPGSTLAPGTDTVELPYQANYKMNWDNVVKYFYQYVNQLATLNHTAPIAPDQTAMAFAQKRALAQTGNTLSHEGSGDYGENLEFLDTSSHSDQEEAYNLVMGWFDDTDNVIPAHHSGHYGHRASLLYGRGQTGLGYNPKTGQVAFDFTDVSNWDLSDAMDNTASVDTTSVGLPKTVFRYYHMQLLGKPKYDFSFKGTAVIKHAAKLQRRNADNTFTTVKTLGKGQAYKISRTVSVDGQTYFGLGGSNYVLAGDASLRKYGTAHVNYNRRYGIQIWTGDLKTVKTPWGTGKKLMGQTSWRVYGKAAINGKTYYNLGGNQYIDARYVTVR